MRVTVPGMDAQHHAGVAALRNDQAKLRQQLEQLDARLTRLEAGTTREAEPAPASTPKHSPPPLPPLLDAIPTPATVLGCCKACGNTSPYPANRLIDTVLCRACGNSFLLRPVSESTSSERPVAPEPVRESSAAITPPVASTQVSVAAPGESHGVKHHPEARSFELWLGTHWFVRIGAISILTGLVFLANYAYQNWIFAKSAGVKVTLLYLFSFTLGGTGWFLQRWQEQLRRYGQVLMATGLAAIYFTTYAAHYFENLQVIASPMVASILLLGIAGFIVWLADRKKSEALALFAIGLAYYTSVINDIRLFTLFSNLALTLAVVFFLIRNRWATLSFASLFATYGAFCYWRFFQDHRLVWQFQMSLEDFWLGTLFLTGYWIAFTAPVFLSRHEQFAGGRRVSFLTFNNAAFFGLTAWTLQLAYPGSFWKLALVFGVVLLGLAALASRTLREDPVARDAYLSKGLILVTIGFMTHFSGSRLSLVLAGQSVAMLVLSYLRTNRIMRGGAYLVAGLSVLLALDDFKPFDQTSLLMGISVAAFMIFNGCWVNRHDEQPERESTSPQVAWFIGLGLLVGFLAAWHNSTQEWRPPLFACLALALTASWYLLRLRELVVFGQGYLLIAQVLWLAHLPSPIQGFPWWNPALVIAITVGLSHWWQCQKSMPVIVVLRQGTQVAYGMAAVFLVFGWLHPRMSPEQWLWVPSLLAVGVTTYGVLTRAWFLVGTSQLFLVFSGCQFLTLIEKGHPGWFIALAPIAALVAISLSAVALLQNADTSRSDAVQPILKLSVLYRSAAVLLSLLWIVEYIPTRERFWVFALCGLALFLWSGWVKRPEVIWFSGAFTIVGFAHYWLHSADAAMTYLPNLLAILALAGQQWLMRKRTSDPTADGVLHGAIIVLVSLTLWWFFTQWVHRAGSGFYHTAVWAGLAFVLFTSGLSLHERVYRRCGMALLLLALGRMMLVDVWKLATIYKIISCIGLGGVLLVLGFIYNKYQEQIRRWI